MGLAVLSQLAYYVPSLLAHLVAFVVAAIVFSRARAAGLLLAAGTALQLVASCTSFGLYTWSASAVADGGWTAADVGTVMSVGGVAASVLRAIGEVGVVAAVAAGAFAAGRKRADGPDPYGYPEA